ncbi:TetR/AcrR family transcriptional regulator [Actinomadura miaoliensis]|uniref:TetR/AcrR family transcriptional regulator n=1 Tax=Actinomadura miaoliensis TaxID=430685 RepID=UPI0031E9C668
MEPSLSTTGLSRRRLAAQAAAARVMARDGIAATSTRAIAAEAGMPRGSFHYCFRSKDELLDELAATIVSDMVQAARAVWSPDAPLDRNLRLGLRAVWEAGSERPDEHLVAYELTTYALHDPARAQLARRQYESYYKQGADYLAFVAEQAGIKWSLPMPTLARLLVTVIDGLFLNWLPDRNTEETMDVLDAFADQLAALAVPSAKPPPTERQ